MIRLSLRHRSVWVVTALVSVLGLMPTRSTAFEPVQDPVVVQAERRRNLDEAFATFFAAKKTEDFRRARDLFAKAVGPDDWRTRLAEDSVLSQETDDKLSPDELLLSRQMGQRVALAAASLRNANFQQALEHAQIAKAICDQILGGPKDNRYWYVLHTLATVHRRMGNYPEAEAAYLAAREHAARVSGQGSCNLGVLGGELAMVYLETEKLDRALKEFALADEQWKLWLSDEFVRDDLKNPLYATSHRVYGTFLSNRGLLAFKMGDQVGARTFYSDAVALFEKLGLVREKAFPLMNLGEIERLAGDKVQARQHFKSAAAIFDQTKEPLYRTYCLSNLVISYAETKDVEQAQRLVPEVEALLSVPIPGTHPLNLAECHRNLAKCHMMLGDRAAAKRHFQKAKVLSFEHSGAESDIYRNSLSGLAEVFLAEGDSKRAMEYLEEVFSDFRVRFDSIASMLGVRDRVNFLETLRFSLDHYLTVALEQESPERLYSHVLGWKGAMGASFGTSRKAVTGPEFEKLSAELDSIQGRLSKFWTSTSSVLEADKFDDVKRLAIRKQEVEALVAAKWPDIADERKPRTWDASSVSRALPPGSVLVDYFVYLHMAGPAPESRVLAFVVRPEGSVSMIRLGSEDLVRESVTAWQSALKSVAGEEFRSASKRLAAAIWAPLEKEMAGAERLVVSPDGYLSWVAFGALPGRREGSYLVEDFPVSYVPSVHFLKSLDVPTNSKPNLLAIGGIDFGTVPEPNQRDVEPQDASSPRPKANARLRYSPLPGTLEEATQAVRTFRESFPDSVESVEFWQDKTPTERRFKAEFGHGSDNRRTHLLLASHGTYRFPPWLGLRPSDSNAAAQKEQNAQAIRLGRFFFSGLAMADANEAAEESEDQILTAEEVHRLDLTGTELVALSGCETGLGLNSIGEGLLGLRQAFHAVGARHVLASLWEVDDDATRELMHEFYANHWGKRMSPEDALRHAQVRLLRSGAGASSHPNYWAGFILTGPPATDSMPLPERTVQVSQSSPGTGILPSPSEPAPRSGSSFTLIVASGLALALACWGGLALYERRRN